MTSPPRLPEGVQGRTLRLRVSDAARSRRFYAGLFGLETDAARSRSLRWPLAGGDVAVLELEHTPKTDEPRTLCVEVGSCGEVLDLFLLARLLGMSPRSLRANTTGAAFLVADPDGNTVRVGAGSPLAREERRGGGAWCGTRACATAAAERRPLRLTRGP